MSAIREPIGVLKDITVADDGSIFISNYSQYNIFKFDKNENFITRTVYESAENLQSLYIRRQMNIATTKQVIPKTVL